MIFKPIRWIVFDITGTLLKFHPSVAEIYYQAAKNVQIEPPFLDPTLMKPAFSKAYKQVNQEYPCFGYYSLGSERDWWKEVVRRTLTTAVSSDSRIKLTTDDHERYFRAVYQAFGSPSSYHVYPDTWKLLDVLKSSQKTRSDGSCYQLGIITNSDCRAVDTTLPTLNLHHHFQFALSSTDYGWMKPDSRQYLKAFEQMQFYDPYLASPEEVLYIGNDIEADYKGARASGFQSVLIGMWRYSTCLCDLLMIMMYIARDIDEKDQKEFKKQGISFILQLTDILPFL